MDLEASSAFLSYHASITFIRKSPPQFGSDQHRAAPVFLHLLFTEPSPTGTDPPFVESKGPWFHVENGFPRMQQWSLGLFHPLDDPLRKAGPQSHRTCRGYL